MKTETASPLNIQIAQKLLKHQLIRASDYVDTQILLREIPAVNSFNAMVEALEQSLSVLTEEQSEPFTRLIAIDIAKSALRLAKEGK